MNCRMNRRGFLKTAAWGATGWCILEHSRSAWSYQANEKMNIALVGVGDRGRGYVNKIAGANHNLAAVCDVNRGRVESIVNLPSDVRKYQDFRKLFDDMDRR